MLNLSVETWIRFLVWMALGVVVYLAYGRRKSVLGQKLAAQAQATPPEEENIPELVQR